MSETARNALIALGITILIVGTVVYTVNYLNRARLLDLAAIEQQITIDTLSLDTEFSLLEAAPCESASDTTGLSSELGNLGDRLAYAEEGLGSDTAQVIALKKQYTLLEIRDYLVGKQLAKACGTTPITVLYFYSNGGDCADCDRAGYALSYLRQTYPSLRVYSFDYHLDIGALRTLVSLEKVLDFLPAFIIQGKTTYGFTSLEDLMTRFPEGALATTTAGTSTSP